MANFFEAIRSKIEQKMEEFIETQRDELQSTIGELSFESFDDDDWTAFASWLDMLPDLGMANGRPCLLVRHDFTNNPLTAPMDLERETTWFRSNEMATKDDYISLAKCLENIASEIRRDATKFDEEYTN